MHILRKNNANFLPFWTTCAKIIFDYPLTKIFMGYGRKIVYAKFLHKSDFLCFCCRHDTIYH